MHTGTLKVAAGVLLGFAVTACEAPPSDDAMPGVEPGRMEAHLRFLADDALEGRETASRGLLIAENYVAAQFRSFGLEPGGDVGTYFQTVPLRQSVRDPSGSSFRLHRGEEDIDLQAGVDFFVSPAIVSAESSVTAPVVFVGYGVHALDQNVDDYDGLDVDGKIVVFLGGRPQGLESPDPHGRLTPSQAAQVRGAVGTITLSSPAEGSDARFADRARPEPRPLTSWIGEDGRPSTSTRRTVGLEIKATMSPRASADLFQGSERSFADIVDEARSSDGPIEGFELPLEVTIGQKSVHTEVASRNVLAILRGSDAELADEFIVITCHLDHVGTGEAVDGDSIYNGAMDNATGVAFMLEVARVLAAAPERPRRSILFFATTAEEHGLVGSSYFVENPTVPRGSIVANINLDAPRMFWPFDEIVAYGAEHSTLRESIGEAAETAGYRLGPTDGFETGASDHFSFLQVGIPGVRIIQALRSTDPDVDVPEIMAEYRPHRPSDDLSLPFDYEIGAELANLMQTIVRHIADAESSPRMNEGDPLVR